MWQKQQLHSKIPIQGTANLPKVKEFLESVGRNSKQSQGIYNIGLAHFQAFLTDKYPSQTFESIPESIIKGEINVYSLIDNFVSNLVVDKGLSPNSVCIYVNSVRSFMAWCDVDIVPYKFKSRVRMPKKLREDKTAIDASDIRRILLAPGVSRRLKSFLLVLATSATRSTEALAIRNQDILWDTNPVTIHIRKEYAKTGVARNVYISEETKAALISWLDWKYTRRRGKIMKIRKPDDLVFAARNNISNSGNGNPRKLYTRIQSEFTTVLKSIGMDKLEEGMAMIRHKITLHTFRRTAKTIISTNAGVDFSEGILGHFSRSPYFTMKEEQRRDIYKRFCEPFLSFLNFEQLENTSKGIVAQLENKDREIAYLRQRDIQHDLEMKALNERMERLDKSLEKVMKLEKQVGIR